MDIKNKTAAGHNDLKLPNNKLLDFELYAVCYSGFPLRSRPPEGVMMFEISLS